MEWVKLIFQSLLSMILMLIMLPIIVIGFTYEFIKRAFNTGIKSFDDFFNWMKDSPQ